MKDNKRFNERVPGILIGDKTEEWCGDSESMKVVDECELHMIKRSERIRVNGVKLNKIYLKKPLAYDHPGKTPLLQMCACSLQRKKAIVLLLVYHISSVHIN